MDRHWRSRIEFCRVFICPWQLITEVENSVQGVGNLFDNLKSDCDKNKSEITKVGKKFDSLKPYCEKNKSEIAKVSDQLEVLANHEPMHISEINTEVNSNFFV
jgi:septal ring factor EnvC (AmiA/AmiB activator)